MHLLRGDVEDALRARRGLAAGLLEEEGHRGGLVPGLGVKESRRSRSME